MGEVVHVALDCAYDEERQGWRVLVRGVFSDPTLVPPPIEGAQRNLVGAFLDVSAGGEPGAFFIEAPGPGEESQSCAQPVGRSPKEAR